MGFLLHVGKGLVRGRFSELEQLPCVFPSSKFLTFNLICARECVCVDWVAWDGDGDGDVLGDGYWELEGSAAEKQ